MVGSLNKGPGHSGPVQDAVTDTACKVPNVVSTVKPPVKCITSDVVPTVNVIDASGENV